jgi:hypothetical protein
MTDENHDTIIRHECAIGELREQGEFILKRLDEQDANDVKTKDELVQKIGEIQSYNANHLNAILGSIVVGLLTTVIIVIWYAIH